MKQKHKKITTMTCIAVGICTVLAASAASYATSNGYEVGKNAAKKLLNNDNYTAEMSVSLSLDGEVLSSDRTTELYDRNGDIRLNRINSSENNNSHYEYYMGTSEEKTWMQDGSYISLSKLYNGTETAHVYENSYDWRRGFGGSFDQYTSMDEDSKAHSDKMIRFAELIGDTLVGDLKNNIVYVSGDDNSSTYEIALSDVQVPEFVNAGFSVIFSQMKTGGMNDPLTALGSEPKVDSASVKFTVDNEGRLLDGTASGTLKGNIDGDIHTATVDISLKMYDYGTTKPERLDLSTLNCPVEHYTMTDGGGITHNYTVNTDGSVTEGVSYSTEDTVVNSDGSVTTVTSNHTYDVNESEQ